jgi:hypothetical protein
MDIGSLFTGETNMSIFNAQGQVNAGSVKDALNTLFRYAAILEEGAPANTALSGQPSLNNEKRDELIARAIMTQEGKLALAQAMANPIRYQN